MATITDAAEALAQLLAAALPEGATATTDPDVFRAGVLASAGAVRVSPPTIAWGGVAGGGQDVTWTLTCAVRPGGSARTAWDALDALIEACASVVDLDTARPGSVPQEAGPALPAYVLTTQPVTVI